MKAEVFGSGALIPVLIASGHATHLTSRLGKLQPSAIFIGKPCGLHEIMAALNRMTVEL